MGAYVRGELDDFGEASLNHADSPSDAPVNLNSPASLPDDILLGTSGGDIVFGYAGNDYIVPGSLATDPIDGTAFFQNSDGHGGAFDVLAHDDMFGDDDDFFADFDLDGDGHLSDQADMPADLQFLAAIVRASGIGTHTGSFRFEPVGIIDEGDGLGKFLFGATVDYGRDTIASLEAGDRIDTASADIADGLSQQNIVTLEMGQTTSPSQLAIGPRGEANDAGQTTPTPNDASSPHGGDSFAEHNVTNSDFSL